MEKKNNSTTNPPALAAGWRTHLPHTSRGAAELRTLPRGPRTRREASAGLALPPASLGMELCPECVL